MFRYLSAVASSLAMTIALTAVASSLAMTAAFAQTGGGAANGGQQTGAGFGAFGAPPVLSGCGTSPSLSGNSNSVYGTVSEGTASPTGCTLTWSPARISTPTCLITFRTATFPVTAVTVVNATTLTWTNAASTLGVFDYLCLGS